MRRYTVFALMAIAVISSGVFADYLVVRKNTFIREQPNKDAKILLEAKPDLQLPLLDDGKQQNGYYHVSLPNSQNAGWIYRNLVLRRSGAIASPAARMISRATSIIR